MVRVGRLIVCAFICAVLLVGCGGGGGGNASYSLNSASAPVITMAAAGSSSPNHAVGNRAQSTREIVMNTSFDTSPTG